MKIRTFVRLGCIASAIILTGCQATTGQTSLYEKYKFQPDNKAYSIGTNGKAGAAWGADSIDRAVDLANQTCLRDGGLNCGVVDINGQPAANFSSYENDVDQNPAATPSQKTVKRSTKQPLLLPGAFGVQPMTFTEIDSNSCKTITSNSISTVPEHLEVELSNAAYMLSGNRYHITKIISNDDESISVIADIYRCSQRTLSKDD
ncbi:hypothetical protein [Enterovibrio norvegicus]|uniref:DUF4189 domain-containing protein n=1 Tax=Enterovibrio norvegicus TaxID=188144 RepID=A0A2N7LD42_9GAMM|nr:hypothetical protein [Enterovibrio norvegicus]PMN93296.1 hypothetical protein BCT23_12855 [Enterovibrio norvegicus]